jgi:hypothetical protein
MIRTFAKSTALAFVTTLLLGASACTVESSSPEGAADVSDGALTVDAQGLIHFADPETFFATLDAVGSMTSSELDAWEDGIGFVSYRREFQRVMARASSAATLDEADALLRANEDIVEVMGDEANPRIKALGYAAVTDRAGLFYVGGTLHKVLPDVVVSSQDGRLDTIDAAIASMGALGMSHLDRMATPAEGVRVARYDGASLSKLQELVPYGCTDYKSAFFVGDDRKVDFDIWTWPYYCADCCGNYYYQVKVEGKLKGFKKNIWGNWTDSNYTTSYQYQNLEFQVTAPQVYGYNGVHSLFNYQPYTVSSSYGGSPGDMKTWTIGTWNVGNMVQNSPINAPYFDKVKGQGKSRGVGNNWAEICCGYAGGCYFPPVCTPRTSCYVGECGTVSDNCGGTLYCGSCGGGTGGGCQIEWQGDSSEYIEQCQ